MLLSIFNSSLLRTFLLFTVLFIGYNVLLLINKNDKIRIPHSQHQHNIIKAEHYMYSRIYPRLVILGSSLSARLESDYLPSQVYNLSFGGGSVLTGLELLKKSNKYPKYLLIEINMLSRGKDDEFLDKLFDPVPFYLKRYFPVFLYNNRPYNVLYNWIREISGGRKTFDKNNTAVKSGVFSKLLRKQTKYYNDLTLDKIRIILNTIEEFKNIEKNNNTILLFFEMPFHQELVNSKEYRFIKRKIADEFPASRMIIRFSASNFRTTDSMHLTYDSAVTFSKLLAANIKMIINENNKVSVRSLCKY